MADDVVKTVRIVIDASKAKEGAGEVEAALKSIDDKLSSLGDTVGHAFGGLKNALLGFLSFDAIMTQVHGLTDAFDRLASKSIQLNASTDWLQAFEFALASSTVKIDEGYKALDKFTRLVGEGAQGNKAAVEVLDRLGVKIYDINRQVRPVNDLFSEAARRIAETTGAADKNALAVQAMGKSAQAVIPALEKIGQGSDALVEAGRKAGAVVSREAVQIWEDLATAADKSMIKWRSFAGETFAESVKKGFDLITDAISGSLKLLQGFVEALRMLSRESMANVDSSNVTNATGLRSNVLNPVNSALDRAWAHYNNQNTRLQQLQGNYDRNPTGAALSNLKDQQTETDTAWQVVRQLTADRGYAAYKVVNAYVGDPNAPPPVSRADFGLPPLPTPGVPGGGGPTTGAYAATAIDPGAADRQNKRIQLLQAEADATKKMADAALLGAQAVNDEEASFKAMQQALEVVGDKAKASDPQVKALAKTFKDLNLEIADSRAIIGFRLQTEDLERQNDILKKRVDLFGAAPEQIAREVAILQVRNDVAKTGQTISEQDIALRADAIEKQEVLNERLRQAQQAQDLWLQPIKSALSSMQQGLAGFFEQLFSGGITSWQQFVDSMKKIFIRMLAELAAVSVIRPIIAPIIAGAQGMGLVSPAVAGQLGYPTLNGSSPSGFSMPSFGMGLGGGPSFMSWQPFASAVPEGGFASVGDLLASGRVAGTGLSSLSFGDILGGVGSIGLGAYSLLSGHGSTGSLIGGAAGIIGGGLGLAASAGLIGSAFGPIGMGIGLLGGILGGVLGGDKPPPPVNRGYGQLAYGSGGFGTSGGAWGPSVNASSLQGPLGQMGTNIQSIFDALGGVKDASKVWGVALQSFNQGDFSNQTSFVVDPRGNKTQWGMGSTDADIGMGTAGAHAAMSSILEGAVGEISANLRKALTGAGAIDLQQLGQTITDVKSFDDALKSFSHTTTDAETALKAIDDKFKSLYDTASKYGFDAAPLDTEKAKEKLKVATDFADGIQRALDDMSGNTLKGALADLDKQKQAAIDTNKALIDAGIGAQDQLVKIEELYGRKRADAVAQALAQAWQQEPALARTEYLFTQSAQLRATLSQMAADTTAIGANPMATQIKGFANERNQFVAGVGSTFGVGSPEYYDATIAAYKKFDAEMKAANDNFTAGLNAMTRALEAPGVANIKNLMDQRAKDLATAIALDGPLFDGILRVGPAVTAALKAWNAQIFKVADDFKYTISQGLLAFTDPLQAQLNDLHKERDAALATARANNDAVTQIYQEQADRIQGLEAIQTTDLYAIKVTQQEAAKAGRALSDTEAKRIADWQAEADLAKITEQQVGDSISAMGDHWVSLLDVQELYLKKETQLKETYLQQQLGSLEDYIQRLTFKDLSGLGPTAALTGATGAYKSAYAQAASNPMSQANLDAFTARGIELAQLQGQYYGSSPQYYSAIAQQRAEALAIDVAARGGTPATPAPANDTAVMSAALMQTFQDGFNAVVAELQKARQDNQELKDLYLRQGGAKP